MGVKEKTTRGFSAGILRNFGKTIFHIRLLDP